MGITKLYKLIGKFARELAADEWVGQTLVVDASCFIHQFYQSAYVGFAGGPREPYEELYEKRWIELCEKWRDIPTTLIFIFDGTAGAEKSREQARRKLATKKIVVEEPVAPATEEASAPPIEKPPTRPVTYVIKPTGAHFAKARKILEHYDYECLRADGEADGLLAEYVKTGAADCAVSLDSDLLAHGCPRMCPGFDCDTIYDLDLILRGLGMSYSQFVDLCILLGCDYNKTDPARRGFGVVNAPKAIATYGRIEDMKLADDAKKRLCEVRRYFID